MSLNKAWSPTKTGESREAARFVAGGLLVHDRGMVMDVKYWCHPTIVCVDPLAINECLPEK